MAKIAKRVREVALAEEEGFNLGKVLDVSCVLERVFDVQNEILRKFHREGVFCKTIEFLSPRTGRQLLQGRSCQIESDGL